MPVRVLFLADSHLGFDLPARPRVERRRRGHDFLANYRRALAPAQEGSVDLVVHGGDVFHHPRVPPSLVFQAFRPLIEIAESGIPVFVIPGNHERSRIPHHRFTVHPKLHIFRRPETVTRETRQGRLALAGFPYQRRIRERFPQVLAETAWRKAEADLRLLCIHHCVEGATVGPANHTFRHAPDVIRCSDLPTEFAAVLSGHIHRHQVLRRDLRERPLPTPVLYPGSVERTAFAETGEEKGYFLLELEAGIPGGRLVRYDFVHLPTRPMLVLDLHLEPALGPHWLRGDMEARLVTSLTRVPRDAVLRIRIHGAVSAGAKASLSAAQLRRLSPPEMNLEVILMEDRAARQASGASSRGRSSPTRVRAEGPALNQTQLPIPTLGTV